MSRTVRRTYASARGPGAADRRSNRNPGYRCVVAFAIARYPAPHEAKAIAPVARQDDEVRGADLDAEPLQPHDPDQRRAAMPANDERVAGLVREQKSQTDTADRRLAAPVS